MNSQDGSPECLRVWERVNVDAAGPPQSHGYVTASLPSVSFSFVVRQGTGISADLSAWPLLAILADHGHYAGFLHYVEFTFVMRQSLNIFEFFSTWT